MKKLLLIMVVIILVSCGRLPEEHILNYEYTFRQDKSYNCGVYSIYVAMNVLQQAELSELERIKIMHDDKTDGIQPDEMQETLLKYGIKSKLAINHLKTKKGKIKYLKSEISKGSPVTLLVTTRDEDKILHWVTLIGYTGDIFHIYDSYEPISKEKYVNDINGQYPGNISLSGDSIIEWWGTGKYNYINSIAINYRKMKN